MVKGGAIRETQSIYQPPKKKEWLQKTPPTLNKCLTSKRS